jgi:hypothetical protein
MRLRIPARQRFAIHAAGIVIAIAVLRMPAAQSAVLGGMVGFADTTERILRCPCWLLDHRHCFSLDRFDPTCPQCM